MCTHTSYSPYSGEGATVSRPYRYSHGSEQQFTEEAYTVAPAEMEEQMTYDPENGQSTFPIAVLMETARNEGLGNRSKIVDKFISCLAPPHLPPSPPSLLPFSFPPSFSLMEGNTDFIPSNVIILTSDPQVSISWSAVVSQ